MSESSRRDDLALEVANFGPVVNGKIDLRPLTIFVGPSNTGKSYLAILIYALHRALSGGQKRGGIWRVPPFYRSRLDNTEQEVTKKAFGAFQDLADQMFGTDGKPSNQVKLVLPAPIAERHPLACWQGSTPTPSLGTVLHPGFGRGRWRRKRGRKRRPGFCLPRFRQ